MTKPDRCKECSYFYLMDDKYPACKHPDEDYVFKTRRRWGRAGSVDMTVDQRRKQRPYYCPLDKGGQNDG